MPVSTVRILAWLGRVMLLAGMAMVGYAVWASTRGIVYVASRSTEATIYFDRSPLAFLIGIALYLIGGILFLWIARALLLKQKAARSMKALLAIRGLFYFLLGSVFGGLGVRFLAEQRLEAVPLSVIFGTLGAFCFWEVLKAFRRNAA